MLNCFFSLSELGTLPWAKCAGGFQTLYTGNASFSYPVRWNGVQMTVSMQTDWLGSDWRAGTQTNTRVPSFSPPEDLIANTQEKIGHDTRVSSITMSVVLVEDRLSSSGFDSY
jgi:hypothetical protein